ncbi:hypothetical protein [Arcobacter lacus]|uniref:Apea-like HEPN domain-containing protein n=1 Tax=Arcobacter lacus TaxID=1912876 RepID=A0ABX5JJG1_9BACT|nr:hypothetical protein [Arcobacter lacus]PUE65227.1 hypothetical protein B0175_07745 [Arcobacter lacus]
MIDRFVVPIYNLRIDNEYNCSGIIDEMKYNILLKTYNASKTNPDYINEEDLKELFKFGGKNSTKNYYDTFQDDKAFIHNYTKTFLLIDIVSENESKKYLYLFQAVINALNLTIEKGISYYEYFPFSQGHSYVKLNGISSLHSYPEIFSPMNEKMLLDEFVPKNSLEITIKQIYDLESKENQYSKIMILSMDYLKFSKRIEKIEQAFLILMITVEAMFKENKIAKSHERVKYLAKLLSNDEIEFNKILYKFKQKNKEQDEKEYFIGIRNSIVHGKEFLERDEMKTKVLELYKYIRRCIIEILDINDRFNLENYYEDLFKNIEVQWKNKM